MLFRRFTLELDLTIILTSIANTMIVLLVSCLFIFIIEGTLEKEKLRDQVIQLSREYFSEAEKLQQMMDAAPLSIILLDGQRCIMAINDTFLQLYRNEHQWATRDELLKQKIDTALVGFETDVIIPQLEDALKGESKSSIVLHNGNKMYITSTSPIKKGYTNEVIGGVIILQDITEVETLRKELNHVERLGLVGQMAAGITHEIRNPMSVVRGFLQLMKEKSPPSLDHYYRIVMEELDRANSIINDFLALAQNRVVNMERCSLHDIIQELTPLLWADANLRGQSIIVSLDEMVPSLYLNTKEIKQLILNLARNGMEAMQEKGQLILETRHTGTGVELTVKDNGNGIPAVLKENLFEPFYTTKANGTGLGLALCLSIMERHGGSITVESEEGMGTEFIVFFPISEGYIVNANA
ncbi:two-component system sensor histidine kinase NtrB [Paenibacillus segetis]|nr:ATP-binding protein [Paenibacillus segetis]